MAFTLKEDAYAEFMKKVERTIFIDCLTPMATESVLKASLEQFGTVKSVQIIHNYLGPENLPQCALVEMKNATEAENVISEFSQRQFLIIGMPRPIRARPAKPELFDDRPSKLGRVINCHWLDKNDPDYETATKLKELALKQAAETRYMLEEQLERDRQLAEQQYEKLKVNFNKYRIIQSAFANRSVQKLASLYNLRTGKDH